MDAFLEASTSRPQVPPSEKLLRTLCHHSDSKRCAVVPLLFAMQARFIWCNKSLTRLYWDVDQTNTDQPEKAKVSSAVASRKCRREGALFARLGSPLSAISVECTVVS